MKHKDLLEKVQKERLEMAMDADFDLESDDGKQAFKEAMEVTEQLRKIEESELAEKQHKDSKIMNIITYVGLPLLTGVASFFAKDYFSTKTFKFEETNSAVSLAGKELLKEVLHFKKK